MIDLPTHPARCYAASLARARRWLDDLDSALFHWELRHARAEGGVPHFSDERPRQGAAGIGQAARAGCGELLLGLQYPRRLVPDHVKVLEERFPLGAVLTLAHVNFHRLEVTAAALAAALLADVGFWWNAAVQATPLRDRVDVLGLVHCGVHVDLQHGVCVSAMAATTTSQQQHAAARRTEQPADAERTRSSQPGG